MKMIKWLAVAAAVFAMSCTYVGKEGSTLEQQFYEVDQTAIATLQGSTISLRAIRTQEVVVPQEVKVSLRAQAIVLRETRTQVRIWIDSCGQELPTCPPEERIRLGIDSVIASTSVVKSILREVSSYGD